jgi:CRISPR/Cas system-associated protein Csm6
MARPKKPEGEVRENILRIRLTDAERAALDREAKARGEETSTWARRTLLALARPLPEPKRR